MWPTPKLVSAGPPVDVAAAELGREELHTAYRVKVSPILQCAAEDNLTE